MYVRDFTGKTQTIKYQILFHWFSFISVEKTRLLEEYFYFKKNLKARSKVDCMEIQCRSGSLKNTWVIQEKGLFIHLRACVRGLRITGKNLQEQRSWQVLFPSPAPQDKHKANLWELVQCWYSLLNKPMPNPTLPCFSGSILSSHIFLNSSAVGPLPQKTYGNLAITMSPDLHIVRLQSGGGSGNRCSNRGSGSLRCTLLKFCTLLTYPQSLQWWLWVPFLKQTHTYLVKIVCATLGRKQKLPT